MSSEGGTERSRCAVTKSSWNTSEYVYSVIPNQMRYFENKLYMPTKAALLRPWCAVSTKEYYTSHCRNLLHYHWYGCRLCIIGRKRVYLNKRLDYLASASRPILTGKFAPARSLTKITQQLGLTSLRVKRKQKFTIRQLQQNQAATFEAQTTAGLSSPLNSGTM